MTTKSTIHILIAEDSPTQREQLRYLLEDAGYTVTAAADGQAALETLQERRPDLVISDVVMPRLDGYGLCKAIKSDNAWKQIPVILVTTLSDPEDVLRGLYCGADNFVRKPYDIKYLISRVDYLLMNLELRKNQRMQMSLEIDLGGRKHVINSERQQILDLLVSTYEQAVQVNTELKQRESELARSNQVLQGMNRIASGLNAVVGEDEVAKIALERALELPGIRGGWIFLDTGADFRIAATAGLPPALNDSDVFAGRCQCQRQLVAGELSDGGGVIRCDRLEHAQGDTGGCTCHASVPLWLGDGRSLGIMNLIGEGDGRFGDEELKVLYSVGNQVAVALERARLYHGLESRVTERTAKLAAEVAVRERIQREQARLTAVIEATPDMVSTATPDGQVQYINPAGLRMLGLEVTEDIAGRIIADNHPAQVTRLLLEEGLPYAAEHGYWSGECLLRRKDGTDIPISQVIISHRGPDGRVEFFSTIVRDITERQRYLTELEDAARKLSSSNEALERERAMLAARVAERTTELTQANEDLTRAKSEAEEASRAKSAFLATMSHEIRTPMNGVVGLVDVLAQSPLNEHQTHLIHTVQESAGTLLGIIDDILDFSKIEAGRLEIEHAPVSVNDLIEGLCTTMLTVAERRGVDLSIFVSPDIPERVLSDDVRLRQVLYNLIGNAIKFSAGRPDRRGNVTLRAEALSTAPLRVAFQVIDNGIGMTPETVQQLFTPFTQAEISTTRRFGGTGLGLAICRRLVDMMQGEIAVTSQPNLGSTFTVTLPFDAAPEQPDTPYPDLSELACILVKDSGLATGDWNAYLDRAGAHVRIAADLSEAARLASIENRPTVVIQAYKDTPPQGLPEMFAQSPDAHHLLVRYGRRRRPRLLNPNILALDGNAVCRRALLQAVAQAAGRTVPEQSADEAGGALNDRSAFTPSVAEARAQGRLILVAEDDEINQKVILQQLDILGHAAEVAGNGEEALKLWHKGGYALLLTDLHMPKMDGYALTETIRREEAGTTRMPILALTANALRGEASRAHAVGIDEYLTKPIRLHLLRTALDKWLPWVGDAKPALEAAKEAASEEAPAPVDISVLTNIVGDDQEIIREFLSDFLTVLRRQRAEIQAAVATSDERRIASVAHKLKSSSRAVGALALGDLCSELENNGRGGDWAEIAQTMEQFERTAEAVVVHIATLLGAPAN